MHLSAPRQVLFALILLLSYVLMSALAVITLTNHADNMRETQGQMLIEQLSQTLADTVAVKDTVGLSLIASRYAALPSVNSLTVTSLDGETLSELGKAPTLAGENFSGDIYQSTEAENDIEKIGTVALTLQKTSLGNTVKNQWLLFVGMALLHFLLWLLYRVVARQYIVKEIIPERAYSGELLSDEAYAAKQAKVAYEADTNALASAPAKENNDFDPKPGGMFANNPLDDIPDYDDMAVADTPAQHDLSHADNRMRLNIQFDDPKNLLPKLSMSIAKPYFKLCDKLLTNAIDTLSDSDIMPKGVSFDKVNFSVAGVSVVALSEDLEKAAFACFLLGQLYLLLHDVTYQRHREIDRFALPCKACVCNNRVIDSLIGLLEFDAIANDILVLVSSEETALFKGQVQMHSFPNPKTVLQREVGVVEGVNNQLMRNISLLRDNILSK